MQLREYQQAALDGLRGEMRKGHRRLILQAVTGAGKTVMASAMIHGAASQGKVVLFVAHRRELIAQASDKLTSFGVRHGLILPGEKPSNLEHVYVGTVQSFTARIRSGSFDPAEVSLIIFDECHRSSARTYQAMLEAYPNARVIGLTATPTRGDEKGLGDTYTGMVQAITYREAFERGFLVRPKYYAPYQPDLADVKVRAGEYADEDLDAAMNKPELTGDIVSHYARYAALPDGSLRLGIVFAVNVRHSIALAEAFNGAGILAAHIDGTTPTRERDEVMKAFRAGEVTVLCNVGIATEGLDVPECSAVVLACPTKSVIKHLQTAGRGLRPAPGKTDCIAEGELVLTDHGLVPIERVTREMRVWDGLNWVSHHGTVCHGTRNVIYYAGLWATPDHRVWTQEGWKAFGECASQQIPIAQTGFGGQAIREREGRFTRNPVVGREAQPPHDGLRQVRNLRARILGQLQQLAARAHAGMPELQSAPSGSKVVGFSRCEHAAALRESQKFSLRGLWGAWNRISIRNGLGRVLMDSEESGSAQRETVGPHRQRWSLRTRQSALVNPAAKFGSHEKSFHFAETTCLPIGSPRSEVRGFNAFSHVEPGHERTGNLRTVGDAIPQAERRVWDILNAGPLHRFTVSGLLVHNCLILDHAGNVLRLGPVEEYEEWTLEKGSDYNPKASKKKERDLKEITCDSCGHLFYSAKICPSCGFEHVVERSPKNIEVAEGELVELGGGKRQKFTQEEKRRWYSMMLYVARMLGKKPGYAYYAYKHKFGCGPDNKWQKTTEPTPPDTEVSGWMDYYRIWQRETWKKEQAAQAALLGDVNAAD